MKTNRNLASPNQFNRISKISKINVISKKDIKSKMSKINKINNLCKFISAFLIAAVFIFAAPSGSNIVYAAPLEDCDLDGYDDATGVPVPWPGYDETKGDTPDGPAGSKVPVIVTPTPMVTQAPTDSSNEGSKDSNKDSNENSNKDSSVQTGGSSTGKTDSVKPSTSNDGTSDKTNSNQGKTGSTTNSSANSTSGDKSTTTESSKNNSTTSNSTQNNTSKKDSDKSVNVSGSDSNGTGGSTNGNGNETPLSDEGSQEGNNQNGTNQEVVNQLESVQDELSDKEDTLQVNNENTTTDDTQADNVGGNHSDIDNTVDSNHTVEGLETVILTKGTLDITEINGSRVHVGSFIKITGTGFAGNVKNLEIQIQSEAKQLGFVHSLADGSFEGQFSIPNDLEAGTHNIVILYGGTEISRWPIEIGPEAADSFIKAFTVGFTRENKGLVPGIIILIGLFLVGAGAISYHTFIRTKR